MKYPNDYIDKIICGDCLEVMKGVPNDSIDLIVTDPPYGLTSSKNTKGGFMGKAWDKAVPSVDIWKECLRILKPGAFAFVMCIPRQDCLARMIVNFEDAGFVISFSPIVWAQAQGFPKAASMSKAADRRFKVERERTQFRTDGRGKWEARMNHEKGDTGIGHADGSKQHYWDTKPTSPGAKSLDGSYAGYSPKPCYELVLCVMCPLSEKTYLDQALANRHGITWLDSGRIPYENDDDKARATPQGLCTSKTQHTGAEPRSDDNKNRKEFQRPIQKGRFAPNLLVSDDILDNGKILTCGLSNKRTQGSGWQETKMGGNKDGAYLGDSGGFSRYFSLDSWAEKNLPESVYRTFPFLIVPKPAPSEKNAGLDELEPKQKWNNGGGGTGITAREKIKHQNRHPTVKPLKLMSYLISIGSQPGSVVYDPFGGSGTTCMASAILDRRYIGTELDPEMCDISERRIAWHISQLSTDEQLELF